MNNISSLFQNNDFNKIKNNINYNEEQLKFIKSPLENSKLLGIPGGGKTESIIGKVLYHYSNKDINQTNQFLILTFSKKACNDFIEKGKSQNRILFNNKNICTIHSIAGKIVYNVLEEKSSSQDTVIVSAINLIENYSELIFEMPELCNLKIIFVDEAQDISYIQYQFILKLSKLTKSSLILIGDPNQNIYQFQNGNDTYLLNHNGKDYKLIKNYRSTPNIVNFINNFRPWSSLTEKMISTKHDNDPFNKKPIIFIGKMDDIIKDVVNKILNSSFPRNKIAIIGPVKKSKMYNETYTNIGLMLFKSLLDEYNIKYIEHYEEKDINNDIKESSDHINLLTIHGAKGLEFHQVFLINFHTATFGKMPTEEKYKELKYLWYVGLSRASYDLNIYIDKNKMPWDELKKCPEELYINNIYIKHQFHKELKFQDDISSQYYSISDILNTEKITKKVTKKMLDDQNLFDLEKILKYDIEILPIFEPLPNKVKDNKEHAILYELFIKNIFNFYYSKKNNLTPNFITKLNNIINNCIIIPKNLIAGYKILKIRYPFITSDLIKLSDLSEIKNKFRKNEEDLYYFICNNLNNNYNKYFFLECENDNNNKDKILECINTLNNNENKKDIINCIFKITFYYYQLNNNDILPGIDCCNINYLEYYIDQVIKFAEDNNEIYSFDSKFKHPKLSIIASLDIINEDKIIDINFSSDINIKDILQILLNQHVINPTFDKEYNLEIWNFYLGNRYIIKLNKKDFNTYSLLKLLSKIINKKMEDMIFFYHLETTGTAYANKKLDIIDRHFEEFSTYIIPSTGLLKPINVPFIPFQLSAKTGITKEDVFENGDNIDIFKKEINEIIEYCNNPIFITHDSTYNDNKLFPFEKCKLIDSKIIIRLFLNDAISNKSLIEIFQYLFKSSPLIQRSSTNVKMLIEIFKKLNITEDKILMKEKIDLL